MSQGDLSDTRLDEVSALLRRLFPHAPHLTPAYLAWLYRDSPDGAALTAETRCGDRVVGHLAGLQMSAWMDGVERRGILLVNTALDATYRGSNASHPMGLAVFERARRDGADFCISVGNSFSTPALVRNGHRLVAPLRARVGIGAPTRRPRTVEPSFERIWTDAALAWRLRDPRRSFVALESRRRSWVATSARPGIWALLHDGDVERPVAEVPSIGRLHSPLTVTVGLDPDLSWRGLGAANLPRRLRPSPLNLTYLDLSGRGPAVPDPRRVVFRALDFDAF